MKQQHTLMKYDPATGEHRPYPSNAHDWRKYHGATAWLYNPWSGDKRDPRDIGMDVNGLLIIPKGEPIYAGSQAELEAEETECVHMCLDDAGVPRADEGGAIFSLWGRVLRFKQMGHNVPHEGPARASCAGPLDAVVRHHCNEEQDNGDSE